MNFEAKAIGASCHMNLREQEYFVALANTESITLAAEHVHITQPAMSQYLKKIEQETGCQLFIREKTGRLVLTPAGKEYLNCCDDILRRWEKAKKNINLLKGEVTPFRIGMASARGAIRLFTLCAQLKESYPDLKVMIGECASTEIPQMVLDGRLNLGCGAYDGDYENLNTIVYSTREGCLLVPESHPLAAYSFMIPGQEELRVPLSVVKEEEIAILSSATVFGRKTIAFFEREHIPQSHLLFLNDNVNIISYVQGGGIGFCTAKEAENGIVPVRVERTIMHSASLITPKDTVLPEAIEKLMESYIATF